MFVSSANSRGSVSISAFVPYKQSAVREARFAANVGFSMVSTEPR